MNQRNVTHSGGPRFLPDDVTECPTCGATTDRNDDLLYSIDRVLTWKKQASDPEDIAVYDAAIAELRGMRAGRDEGDHGRGSSPAGAPSPALASVKAPGSPPPTSREDT